MIGHQRASRRTPQHRAACRELGTMGRAIEGIRPRIIHHCCPLMSADLAQRNEVAAYCSRYDNTGIVYVSTVVSQR